MKAPIRITASVIAAMLCLTGVSAVEKTNHPSVINCFAAGAEEKTPWDGSIDTSWYDSQESELHISTAEEFAGLASIVNGGKTMKGQTVILDNDIYLNSLVDTHMWGTQPPKNNWTPIGNMKTAFEGVLDGNHKTVYGLYYSSEEYKADSGLFGMIENAAIKNLSVRYAYTVNIASILCGFNTAGTISNCTVDATAQGTAAFGGVSYISTGTIYNCTSQGTYDFDNTTPHYRLYVGGICGKGSTDNCTNEASIGIAEAEYVGGITGTGDCSNAKNLGTITVMKASSVGGICGNGSVVEGYNEAGLTAANTENVGGVIGYGYGSNLHNNGEIIGSNEIDALGGIMGVQSQKSEYCYNKGRVISSASKTGGVCGNSTADIYSCTNTAQVYSTSKIAGGITGLSSGNAVKCCGNSGQITGLLYVGGIAGQIGNPTIIAYCYNKNTVTATENDSLSGGIAGAITAVSGKNEVKLRSCYNTGDIIGKGHSGGIAGRLMSSGGSNPIFRDSYSAAANVEGNTVGGIFGHDNNSTYTMKNCYYLNAGAPSGVGNNSKDAGIAKSAVNMKKEAFRNNLGDPFYYISEDYPILCWEKGLLVIELNQTEIELDEFHKTEQLSAVDLNDRITWTTSDETVATVNGNGLVTAVGNGTCVISAVIDNSKCDCFVSVSFDYYLEESGFRLDVDKGKTIIVYSRNSGMPVDVSDLKFTSSNEKVASVNNKGVVSANSPGTAYINIEIGSLTLKCKVVVPTLMCDVNEDGEFNVTDIVLLQKWLLSAPNTHLANWKAADLCEDNRLDVFDLAKMKKELLNAKDQ